jgi:hypothetical protein
MDKQNDSREAALKRSAEAMMDLEPDEHETEHVKGGVIAIIRPISAGDSPME